MDVYRTSHVQRVGKRGKTKHDKGTYFEFLAGVIPRPGCHPLRGSGGWLSLKRVASPLEQMIFAGNTSLLKDGSGERFSADESRDDCGGIGVGETNGVAPDVLSRSVLSRVRSPRIEEEISSWISPVNRFGGFTFVRSLIFFRGNTSDVIAGVSRSHWLC